MQSTERRILLTGAGGLIGRAVMRWARDRGLECVAADVAPIVDGLKLDVADWQSVRGLLQDIRPRAVIHLAAMVGVATERAPHQATIVNVAGTSNVLEAARLAGVRRVVLASSIMREAGPSGTPRNLYGAHKLVAEMEAERYRALYGADPVVIAVTASLGQRPTGSSPERAPHQYILEQAHPGAVIELNCDPGWALQLRRVDCVAAMFGAAATLQSCRPFYATGGLSTTIGDLANEFQAQAGCQVRFHGGQWPSLPHVDGSAAERDFGVQPEDLPTMVRRALLARLQG